MNIFISWAGDRSRIISRTLRDIISIAFQASRVFLSTDDIPSGSSWVRELGKEIKNSDIAIICLTSDNISNPWLSFEAGALVSSEKTIIPLLVDTSSVDLSGPLSAFQSVTLSKSGIRSLLASINNYEMKESIPDSILDKLLESLWPEFERSLSKLPPPIMKETEPTVPEHNQVLSDREILEEILKKVDRLEKEFGEIKIGGKKNDA